MELQQLEYFRVVAHLQHMTRAAETLNISQPALSKSIAQLEQEIGAPLFDRQGRSIVLNRYGQLMLRHAEHMLQEWDKAKQEIQDLVSPGHGEVTLGFIHTLGMEIVPELMAEVRKLFPYLNFTFSQSTSLRLLRQLEAGEVDLCLTQPIQSTTVQVQWRKLWSEELYVIVPKNHHLATREGIRLAEIAGEPFISIRKGNSLRKIIDHFLQKAGVTPNVIFSGEEIHTVAGFVGAGHGVSFVPKIKGMSQYNIVTIPVVDIKCERDIGLAVVEGRYLSPTTERFIDFIAEYLQAKYQQ